MAAALACLAAAALIAVPIFGCWSWYVHADWMCCCLHGLDHFISVCNPMLSCARLGKHMFQFHHEDGGHPVSTKITTELSYTTATSGIHLTHYACWQRVQAAKGGHN